jgi:putative ABC transport system substrate-binding protein
MISRRTFVVIGMAGLVSPAAAMAQRGDASPRIGCLTPTDPKNENQREFRRGLRDLGYIENQNIVLEYRFGSDRNDRLHEFAADLVRLNVNVIFTAGTEATAAARKATSTIPIVAVSGDPIGSGFAESLARPGGNTTGLAILTPELSTKWIDLGREIVPGVSRIAVLLHREDGGPQLRALEPAARLLGVQVVVLRLQGPEEIAAAFESARQARAEVIVPLSSPVLAAHRQTIVTLASRYRLPAVYEHRLFVNAGGLLSYGPNFAAIFYRAATYVDKVLRGARPAELPIEQPTKFELVINLKTAKALGLTIPPSLLLRADQVIE